MTLLHRLVQILCFLLLLYVLDQIGVTKVGNWFVDPEMSFPDEEVTHPDFNMNEEEITQFREFFRQALESEDEEFTEERFQYYLARMKSGEL